MDMLAASKDEIVDIIRSTVRFGENYALRKHDAIIAAAKDAAVFGRALRESLHEAVENLQDTTIYDQTSLLQSLQWNRFSLRSRPDCRDERL